MKIAMMIGAAGPPRGRLPITAFGDPIAGLPPNIVAHRPAVEKPKSLGGIGSDEKTFPCSVGFCEPRARVNNEKEGCDACLDSLDTSAGPAMNTVLLQETKEEAEDKAKEEAGASDASSDASPSPTP